MSGAAGFWCGRQSEAQLAASVVDGTTSSPSPSASLSNGDDDDGAEKQSNLRKTSLAQQQSSFRDNASGSGSGGGDEARDYDPGPGCRPCCSNPHARSGYTFAIASTLAFGFAFAAVVNCHYLTPSFTVCLPPDPEAMPPVEAEEFGYCGECHCIPGEEAPIVDDATGERQCPTVPGAPDMNFDPGMVGRYYASECLNPIGLTCNPYTDAGCETTPPQDPADLAKGENVECAVKYTEFLQNPINGTPELYDTSDTDNNGTTTTTSPSCPAVAQYELRTYPYVGAAAEDGAYVTHRGACGVCSTLQDLAAYIEHTDLVDKGTECSFRAMWRFEDGVKCYMEVGFTEPCAAMWVYNGFQTKDRCAPVCGVFTALGNPNNAPPPTCDLARCLLCDETASGPEFAAVAARTRRRTGLLSMIARPCSALLDVRHVDPCDAANAEAKAGGRLPPATKQEEVEGEGDSAYEYPPDDNGIIGDHIEDKLQGKCLDYTDDLGLFYYSAVKQGGGLVAKINPFSGLASAEELYYRSEYGTCHKYNFKAASKGLWADIQAIFGPSFTAASAFAVFAVVLGFFGATVAWLSCCAAFLPGTWLAMAIVHAVGGLFILLSLLFFASGVCEHGCAIGPGGVCAIVSGVLFFAAAVLCIGVKPYDKRMRAIQCCCCPSTDDEFSGGVTEIAVQRTIGADGSVTTETVTTHPGGFRNVERTVCLPDRKLEDAEARDRDVGDAEAAAAAGKSEEVLETEPLLANADFDEGPGNVEETSSPSNEDAIERAV